MKNKKPTYFQWLWKNRSTRLLSTSLLAIFMSIFAYLTFKEDNVWRILTPILAGGWVLIHAIIAPFFKYRSKDFEKEPGFDIDKAADFAAVSTVFFGKNEAQPNREYFKRIILAGPAGSGKDFLRDKLRALQLLVDVSYTTRNAREGEQPGYTYQFVGEDHFKQLRNRGRFYESVSFNGAWYGTLNKSWEKSVVFIMTPSGISQISEEDREDCVIIYLNIDEEIRKKRMEKRSDGGFDKVERRIAADNKDFKGFTEKADMVITDPLFDPEETIKTILTMAHKR